MKKIKNDSFLKIHFLCLDSPYTAAISAGVLALQETGKLKELKIKWWENERGGGACKVCAN